MRLNWLTLHWERMARRDPFFAVLTDVNKRFGARDLDAFYRTGVDEIAAVLHRAGDYGIAVARRRALDFGCGVGRLTLALAEHFASTDGVDISAAMLKVARQRCSHPDRCRFHRNAAEDLSLFSDGSFTFVYSTLVLQHMAPRLSARYIREFVRVLAADGLLVFQLPSAIVRRDTSPDAVRSAVAGPLAAEAFRARVSLPLAALIGHAGERMLLDVAIENRSSWPWPSLPDGRGRYRIHVANRWLDMDGRLLQRDDERAELPFDIAAGGRAEVLLGVRPPAVNGHYLLEIDLVQENVGWFAEHGSPTLRVPVDVSGGSKGPPLTPIDRTRHASSRSRFSERHPRAFAAMRATGVRDLYWMARRGLDTVKSRRDALIRRTLHPIVNRWERVSLAPRMEMHCVPQEDVRRIVEASGGRIVQVEEETMAGGYQSSRYWVIKDAVADKVSP